MCKVSRRETIFEQCILIKEKGWEQQAFHQLEKTKPICPMQPIENRNSTFSKRYLEEEQLYVQVRLQGCIFLHSSVRGIKEICESLLARQSFSIPLPLLWSGTSTLHISKFLKLSLAFVCQLGTLIITYLNNMLIIDRSVEEILVYRNKAILPIELGWFEFCWVFW